MVGGASVDDTQADVLVALDAVMVLEINIDLDMEANRPSLEDAGCES